MLCNIIFNVFLLKYRQKYIQDNHVALRNSFKTNQIVQSISYFQVINIFAFKQIK